MKMQKIGKIMSKILDIDMYKNGFDAKSVDCFHNPIAAAAGYFNRNYYFYYCFLHCLTFNTVTRKHIFENDYISTLLQSLNLYWNIYDYKNNTGETSICMIINEIKKGHPVIVCVKYNSLFYSQYYKNKNFKSRHCIVINGYNENNDTFTIKEMTLLRDSFKECENSDMHFSLQICSDMLKNILDDSNMQFREEYSYFEGKIFSISSNENMLITTNNILDFSLPILQNWQSEFNNTVKNYNDISFIEDINFYLLQFVGGLKPIFKFLSLHAADFPDIINRIKKCEKETETIKRNIFTILIKAKMKNQNITPLVLHDLTNKWVSSDNIMTELIAELINSNVQSKFEYKYLDIFSFYNNKAFEHQVADQSIADLTGEGTHFLFENILFNTIWQKGSYSFVYNYNPNKPDNITCEKQIIELPKPMYISNLLLLGCAEFGSFAENIKVETMNGCIYEFTTYFSDFFQPAIYGEDLYWSGTALDRKHGKTTTHSFNARLFAKRYKINSENIIKIYLPACINIHIFAITLEIEKK